MFNGNPIDGFDPSGEATCAVSSYVAGGEGNGSLHVSANCRTAYSGMPWALQHGNLIQSYQAVFPAGVGMTTDAATRLAVAHGTDFERGIFGAYMGERTRNAIFGLSAGCQTALFGDGGWSEVDFISHLQDAYLNDAQQSYVADSVMGVFGYGIVALPGGAKADVSNWSIRLFFNVTGYNAFTSFNSNGSAGNQVVLRLGVSAGSTMLVHEMLHRYTGLGDALLVERLGYRGDRTTASQWISDQLSGNCPGMSLGR